MEKYINLETIIKDSTWDSFKDNILCSKCKGLMIEPFLCFNCSGNFCKNCIEKSKKKNGTCPNNCKNPSLKEMTGINNLISKFKFKCIKGCGEEILFENIENHYNSNCLEKKPQNPENEKTKFTFLTKEQMAKLRNEGKEINYMTSK